MGGYTKGEWSLPHFAQPDVDCQCAYVLSDDHCGAICTVHASGEGNWRITGDNPKFAEAVANARLIAAAPGLLNALMTLTDVAEDRGIPCDAARAAIAKATGEQS